MTARSAELAANLRAVRRAIDAACDSAGRDPAGVTLVGITKTWPVEDVRALAGLGLREFGENRHAELGEKAEQTAELALRWHFVGQLQANKARVVAGCASVVHSVDRQRLVEALSAAAVGHGRTIDALIQVSLDGDVSRGGAAPAEVGDLAAAIAAADGLRLAGVMAVPPLGADPSSSYQRLAAIAADLQATHPTATTISAGMSADMTAAIQAGSTLVRVGTALLGGRAPLVG
ncbi:MAG: dependent protein [Frankiaceae bacterium]|nr:dependent protein [Frankiaceae bacterium]